MTTPLGAVIKAGLGTMRFLLGKQTVRWYEKDIPCVASSARRGTTVIWGGVDVNIQLSIYIRLEEFESVDTTEVTIDSMNDPMTQLPVPVCGKLLQYEGRNYTVVAVRRVSGLSHYEFDLADNNI